MLVPWLELIMFMMGVLMLSLYGLTVSGHFPSEFRADDLTRGAGAVIMWGTMLIAGAASVATLLFAWATLPWYAILLGGGMTLLLTPLLLQLLPDSFVNGRTGLLTFAGAAALAAVTMWLAVEV
jgi:hypothetical protein